ncbi:MAG: LytTR family DNA-binding domain-containing protein [Clostridium sp.]|nr:LytTR family DNA-binding domain-containing protein [Clostridium sp.]
MKKSVLVLEDNKIQLEMLRKLVLEVDERTEVYAVRDATTAYRILIEKTIDVFVIDIILDSKESGDTSGMRLVERVRRIPKYMFTPVVFVTSLEDTTKYAYTDLNCLGYIEKPFSSEVVKEILIKAMNYTTKKEKDPSYCFRKDGILYPVKVRDILYMESINHEICIHMKNDNILTIPYKTCKQLLDEIDADCLIQCSRNAIINKDYVYNIDIQNKCITFKESNDKVLIGITFKKKVLAEFTND